MSYKRKAPAAKTLSVSQQLSRLRNAVAASLPFQAQNSIALLEQMKQHDRPLYDAFCKGASEQRFFPARTVTEGLKANPYVYSLPVAKHFIDTDEDPSSFEPRTFYHASSIEAPDKLATNAGAYSPRCGLTGLFFAREEVVDNLQAAAKDIGFKSPFWIRADHPGLQSGYLTVRNGSDSICVSLTASVISIEDVVPFDRSLWHYSLLSMVDSKTGLCNPTKEVPAGMNAFSGKVTASPYVQSLPKRGLWISHDQLLFHNLYVTAPKTAKKARATFALSEIEQWTMYNADQLTVPGRLGLRKSAGLHAREQLFQPV